MLLEASVIETRGKNTKTTNKEAVNKIFNHTRGDNMTRRKYIENIEK